MNQIVSIILLTLVQFIAGAGLITLLRCRLRPGIFLPVSVLLGLGVFSTLPFILQLLFIPHYPYCRFPWLIALFAFTLCTISQAIQGNKTGLHRPSFQISFVRNSIYCPNPVYTFY